MICEMQGLFTWWGGKNQLLFNLQEKIIIISEVSFLWKQSRFAFVKQILESQFEISFQSSFS